MASVTQEEKKEYLKTALIDDYLTEDPVIDRQLYFILSYLLPGPKNEIDCPIFKVRGSYRTQEECKARIDFLKKDDAYFHMFVCEVGKFGKLIPPEDINVLKTDIDIQYDESKLNEMVKSHKDAKDKADRVFTDRVERNQTAEMEEETPEEIKKRIEYLQKEKENAEKQLDDYNKAIEKSINKLKDTVIFNDVKISDADNDKVFGGENIIPNERRN